MKYKLKEGLAYRKICGNIYIVDIKNSMLYKLNDTATFILEGIIKNKTVDKIVKSLLDRYEVEESVLKRDVEEIIKEMLQIGLIQKR